MKALIVADVQNDFMADGSLPMKESDQIIPIINNILSDFELARKIGIQLIICLLFLNIMEKGLLI